MYQPFLGIAELVRLALTVYLTLAIMGVGFGTMIAGSSGARAAARVFFQHPLHFLAGKLVAFATLIMGSVWAILAGIVALLGRAARGELRQLGHDLRWLVRKFDR